LNSCEIEEHANRAAIYHAFQSEVEEHGTEICLQLSAFYEGHPSRHENSYARAVHYGSYDEDTLALTLAVIGLALMVVTTVSTLIAFHIL